MPVEYVDFETARNASGLRMVVVTGVPSPWGEAAKGILHAKRISWQAVRLDQSSDAMADWTGERSGPVVMYDDEAPRSRFVDILLLAERLGDQASLLPSDADSRAHALGLAHEICGELGLGWCRRNQAVHAGLSGGDAGFPQGVAQYLAQKYGYRADEAERYDARVIEILGALTARLSAQSQAGSPYYFGDTLSAVDIYSATFMALFDPLPQDQCPMPDAMRAAFGSRDPATRAALSSALLEHRDFIYAKHLELPLTL
jgi:glutathione S-transferase